MIHLRFPFVAPRTNKNIPMKKQITATEK